MLSRLLNRLSDNSTLILLLFVALLSLRLVRNFSEALHSNIKITSLNYFPFYAVLTISGLAICSLSSDLVA